MPTSKSLRSRCTPRAAPKDAYSLVNVSFSSCSASSGAETFGDVNLTKGTYRASLWCGQKHRRILCRFRPVLTCRCLLAATSHRGSRHCPSLPVHEGSSICHVEYVGSARREIILRPHGQAYQERSAGPRQCRSTPDFGEDEPQSSGTGTGTRGNTESPWAGPHILDWG